MRNTLFLLLILLPCFLYAQYPNNPRKLRLGYQTTAAGLVHIKSGSPSHTPSADNDAWMVLDTTNNKLYYYDESASAWEDIIDDFVRDTVFNITSVPDTSTIVPLQGDMFVNSTGDTIGVYRGADGWKTISLTNTISITADAGATQQLTDGDFHDLEGGYGIATVNSSGKTTFKSDTTEIVSTFALQDSLAKYQGAQHDPIILLGDHNFNLDPCGASAEAKQLTFYIIDDTTITNTPTIELDTGSVVTLTPTAFGASGDKWKAYISPNFVDDNWDDGIVTVGYRSADGDTSTLQTLIEVRRPPCTKGTIDSIQYVADTTSLSPTRGDEFVNSTRDTSGTYDGSRWQLKYGGSGGGGSTTLTFAADSGSNIDRTDGETLSLSGGFGITTESDGSSDIEIEADTSATGLATVYAVGDTAADIRNDMLTGSLTEDYVPVADASGNLVDGLFHQVDGVGSIDTSLIVGPSAFRTGKSFEIKSKGANDGFFVYSKNQPTLGIFRMFEESSTEGASFLLSAPSSDHRVWFSSGQYDQFIADPITIGSKTAPTTDLDIDGDIRIRGGTTAQRPTGASGIIRYNSTETLFEGYNGTDWTFFPTMSNGLTTLDAGNYSFNIDQSTTGLDGYALRLNESSGEIELSPDSDYPAATAELLESTSTSLTATTSWTHITGLSSFNLNDFTATDSTLTYTGTETKKFLVQYDGSIRIVTSGSGPAAFDCLIYENAVQNLQTRSKVQINAGGAETWLQSVSGNIILELETNDVVSIRYSSSTGGPTFTMFYFNLSITEI